MGGRWTRLSGRTSLGTFLPNLLARMGSAILFTPSVHRFPFLSPLPRPSDLLSLAVTPSSCRCRRRCPASSSLLRPSPASHRPSTPSRQCPSSPYPHCPCLRSRPCRACHRPRRTYHRRAASARPCCPNAPASAAAPSAAVTPTRCRAPDACSSHGDAPVHARGSYGRRSACACAAWASCRPHPSASASFPDPVPLVCAALHSAYHQLRAITCRQKGTIHDVSWSLLSLLPALTLSSQRPTAFPTARPRAWCPRPPALRRPPPQWACRTHSTWPAPAPAPRSPAPRRRRTSCPNTPGSRATPSVQRSPNVAFALSRWDGRQCLGTCGSHFRMAHGAGRSLPLLGLQHGTSTETSLASPIAPSPSLPGWNAVRDLATCCCSSLLSFRHLYVHPAASNCKHLSSTRFSGVQFCTVRLSKLAFCCSSATLSSQGPVTLTVRLSPEVPAECLAAVNGQPVVVLTNFSPTDTIQTVKERLRDALGGTLPPAKQKLKGRLPTIGDIAWSCV